MKIMLKIYFSHRPIYIYFLLFCCVFTITLLLKIHKTHLFFYFLPILVTPFYEWLAHKYLLHAIVDPKKKKAYRYQQNLHYNHHTNPNEIKYIFAPVSAVFIVFIQAFFIFSLFGLSFKSGLAGLSSSILIFLYYEWTHLGHHINQWRPLTSYGQLMKKAHSWHHYSNENFWWGITSNIGDLVLGTFPRPNQVPSSPTTKAIAKSNQSMKKFNMDKVKHETT